MRSLSDTRARIASLKRAQARSEAPASPEHLGELAAFGDNPGALRARIYVPTDLPPTAPLVVVLHGCTQTASAYDVGSGWSRLAERQKFAVLFPEQQRANNAALCFNWFLLEDTRRQRGEACSIASMIDAMIDAHRLDGARVFVRTIRRRRNGRGAARRISRKIRRRRDHRRPASRYCGDNSGSLRPHARTRHSRRGSPRICPSRGIDAGRALASGRRLARRQWSHGASVEC